MTGTPADKMKIIRALIRRGDLDDYLPSITAEIYARKLDLAEEKAAQVEIGNIIILTSIKPKMLEGARVRVLGFEGNLIRCELLTGRSAKWYRGAIIRIRRTHVGTIIKDETVEAEKKAFDEIIRGL